MKIVSDLSISYNIHENKSKVTNILVIKGRLNKIGILRKKFKRNESSLTPNLIPHSFTRCPIILNLFTGRLEVQHRDFCNVTIAMQLLLYLQLGSSCTGFPSIFNVLTLLQPLSPGIRLSVSERESMIAGCVLDKQNCE